MDDLLDVINQGRFKPMKTRDSFVYKVQKSVITWLCHQKDWGTLSWISTLEETCGCKFSLF
jgi:hypothetical protein